VALGLLGGAGVASRTYTGLGLGYALSNAVFSGCAGLIMTETVKRTGSVDIPGYYAATCAVSVLALAKAPQRKAGWIGCG